MISNALGLPERFPGRTIVAVGALMAVTYAWALVAFAKPDGRVVMGDAVHYYVYVRSAVFDGDLYFRNDYVRLYGLTGQEPGTEWVYEPTATGHTRNMMSIGPPIVWAPLFLTVTAAAKAVAAVGVAAPPDGFGRIFQASAGFSGIAAATSGAWITFMLCARFFTRRVAIWSTLTVWLSTSALYYTLVSPTYSHAASILAVSALMYAWATTIGDPRLGRYARLGALAGFTALVRWQDAIFLIVPGIDACRAAWSGAGPLGRRTGRMIAQIAVTIAAAAAAFLPQNLVWLVLYGRAFAMPQGGEFMQWTDPHLVDVLFSQWHGLITWTPVVAVAAAGIPLLWRHSVPLALAAAVLLIVSWYVNAAVLEWWAGEAFGSRRFVSCFPIFALGVAAVGARMEKRRAAAAVTAALVFVAFNVLLLFQYELFMHGHGDIAPYPGGSAARMMLERFVVPVRLVLEWWRG